MPDAPRGHRDGSGSLEFWRHVQDLRGALLWSLLGWGAATLLAWNWWDLVWSVLAAPLQGMSHPPRIVATTPTAAVTASVQLALAAGSLIASPWVLWHLWRFASPALLPREKRVAVRALFWTVVLFALGVVCGYWTILPMTLRWLSEYGADMFDPLWSVQEYTSMSVKMLVGAGAMFEWPLLTYALASLGAVHARQLLSWSRGAIVAIFVLAAILTPPDPVSQCILAAPMLALYFAGVGTAALARAPSRGDA